MSWEIREGDCLALLPEVETESVSLIVADPPYGLRKGFAGDYNADQALTLVAAVLPELRRVLKPNGSLYLFAGPQVAARVEVLVGEHLHVLNCIRWVKESGWHRKAEKETLCSYLSPWEAIIFAEHPAACVEYEQASEGIRAGVFESLRQYLDSERRRAGVRPEECDQACFVATMASHHYFVRSQWQLPTAEHYVSLRDLFNAKGNGSGPYLRREYEDLRREYEDLRRPFAVSADVPYTDVWEFPPVSGYRGKHPCEKPQALLEHIISASSRPEALVLDCFAGSGSTGRAALKLGRDFLGMEIDPRWCGHAETERAKQPPRLELTT